MIHMDNEVKIREANPWWKEPSKILDDKEIKKWNESQIRYEPRIKRTIEYEYKPDNTVVYTIRGPRQVGKTTLVKLQIKDFLLKKDGVNPWNILYYSFDLENTQRDMVDVIETYLKTSKRQRKDRRTYIFLDEISSIKDWQRGIKWLVDGDKLWNTTILGTGSHTIDIKNAAERLPGRRGDIKDSYDKILLPMKFVEYAMLLNKDINKIIRDNQLLNIENRKLVLEKLILGEIDDKIYELSNYQNEINELLNEYTVTGGTPKVVNEKVKDNTIYNSTYHSYLQGITGYLDNLSKKDVLVKQFMHEIIKSLSSNISWNGLAENANISTNTAIDYAQTLEELFVVSIIKQYSEKHDMPRHKNNKKIYFQDPLFLHMFNGLVNKAEEYFEYSIKHCKDEINQSRIIEGIVANHLIQLDYSSSPNKQFYEYQDHICYWKDRKNREVDFILPYRVNHGNEGYIQIPIEVKFRNKINAKEQAPLVEFLKNPHTNTKKGIVVSKSSPLDIKTDYVEIPASLFLLLV